MTGELGSPGTRIIPVGCRHNMLMPPERAKVSFKLKREDSHQLEILSFRCSCTGYEIRTGIRSELVGKSYAKYFLELDNRTFFLHLYDVCRIGSIVRTWPKRKIGG